MSSHSSEHIEELIQHAIFDPEDLKVNRSGHVSLRQKRKLYLSMSFWVLLAILETGVLLPFILVRNAVMIVLGFMLFITLAYQCYKEILPFWKDLEDDTPKSVAGRANKKFSVKRTNSGKWPRTAFCTIRVGHEVFSISPAVYDRLIDDGFYRIYYVAHTRRIINIEPL